MWSDRRAKVFPAILGLAIGTVCFASCKPKEPEPAATPVPTPHPATGSSAAAVRFYPDLGRKETVFNRTFRDLYEEKLKSDPHALTKADWPLTLAYRTASLLRVEPAYPTPAPTPPPAQVIVTAPKATPAALERGAYNEKRSTYRKSPIVLDEYGRTIQR